MTVAVFPEWLNQNAYRAYPFMEDAQLQVLDPDGKQVEDRVLPNYLLVDFVLTLASETVTDVRLYSLVYVGGFLTFIFADDAENTVATLAVDGNVHSTNQAYAIIGQDTYEDARGKAVLGDLAGLTNDLPDGIYYFQGALLEPTTIRPDLRGVRSLRTGFGDTLSDYIHGHVKLLEGTNIRLTYLPDYNAIRIDAVNGAGFNQECACEGIYQLPSPMRSINGVAIEDLVIVGDGKCVEVTTQGNTISIKDTCSEPCCGCPELEFITTHLELLEATLSRVEQYTTLMRDQLANLISTMIVSTR